MSTKAESNTKSYEWKVDDLDAFKSARNGLEFKSPFFEIHGFKWCLRVFPNGSNRKKKDNVNCFLWLRSLPPKYSKIAVNITMSLKELDIQASFPHQYSDKSVTRGWITGTLKTLDIQHLNAMTFIVKITLHDIYDISGNLLLSTDNDDEKETQSTAMLTRQSSALILDKQNNNSLKIEELFIKIENIQNTLDNIIDKQNENDENFNSLMNEITNMKQLLADEHKTDTIKLNKENEKVKIFLENECQMGQYFKLFVESGCDNMAIVKLLNVEYLEKMGIQKIGHRIQIAHKIDVLSQQIE